MTAGSAGVKVQATSNNQAIVEAWMLSIGGLGSIAVNSADAEVTSNADTEALVLANATVSAPAGAVQVLATSTNTANASGLSVSGGLALTVNVMLITATVAGGTKASFDGTIPSTGTKTASLLVQTRGRNQAITDTDIASVSVGLSGTAVSADAQVTSGADTEAFVGSNASVNVSGGVTIDAQLTTDGGNGKQNYALAGISGGSVGGISAGVVLSNALVAGSVTAKLNGAVTNSSFITINADSTMEANADTTFFGIGALSFSGSSTDAEVSGDTIAGGDSGSASTNGLFQVTSDSANKATATSDGATVGLGTVDVKLPQALVSGSTKAVYLGQVTNGTGATATANSANTATATADMVTIGGSPSRSAWRRPRSRPAPRPRQASAARRSARAR